MHQPLVVERCPSAQARTHVHGRRPFVEGLSAVLSTLGFDIAQQYGNSDVTNIVLIWRTSPRLLARHVERSSNKAETGG